jgi:Flp pilus assembly protein TadD
MSGQGKDGLSHWRDTLEREPNNVQLLNETAWVLATSRDASLRNGSEAVTLAERAVRLTSGKEPEILGTLAAAYAEAGQFDQAVATDQRAKELAGQQGNAALVQTLGARMEKFKESSALRQ